MKQSIDKDYGVVEIDGQVFKLNDTSIDPRYRIGWIVGYIIPKAYRSLDPKKSRVRDIMGELLEEIRKLEGDGETGFVETQKVESMIISAMIEIVGLIDSTNVDLDKIQEAINALHLEFEKELREKEAKKWEERWQQGDQGESKEEEK